MALTQEQVDYWFAQNPEATAEEVAEAVKGAGGLEANAGLADMIANRYNIDTSQVNDYYNQYTAPTGGLPTSNTVVDQDNVNTNVGGLPTAPADNINSNNGYVKPSIRPTSGGVSNVIEGDNIDTQIAQLPEEYASWQTSSAPGYIDLIRKDDGAILDRRKNATFSDADLLKMGLSFIPGMAPFVAGYNAIDAARKGDWVGAAIGATGLMPGMQNVNTALRVGQAVDQGNTFGAITALAGNTDAQKFIGLGDVNVGGYTAKDAISAANLASAAQSGNWAQVIANAGSLANSPDTVLAGKALAVLQAAESGNINALTQAVNLFNTTGTKTGKTKVFGDASSLSDIGASAFAQAKIAGANDDEAFAAANLAEGNEVALPSGVQLAAADTGTVSDAGTDPFKVLSSGVPIYAESKNASAVDVPFGYSLLSISESDNKPEGSYYDITANAWFKPDANIDKLLTSGNIKSDIDLFNSSQGDLDAIAADADSESADYTASFLKSIGINTTDELKDSKLSNADIEEMIGLTDFSGTTGSKAGDDIPELVVTDNKDKGDDIPELVITDKKDEIPELVITDTKDEIPEVVVTDTKDKEDDTEKTLDCPEGYEPNADNTACIPVIEIVDKKCGEGFVYDEDLKQCVPIDEKKVLDCPEGYEPNEEGTACIPVIEIVDKKCEEGYVYDEELKQCVPIEKKTECGVGYHWDEATKSCVKDTVVTPPFIPPITTTKTSAATPFTPAQGGSGKDYQFLPEKLLKTYMTSGSFKDPLAGVKKAQQEFVKEEIMQQGVDPRLAALLAARVTGEEPPPKATYNYGEEPSSIDDILGGSERRYAGGGYVKPLMAEGGMALPLLAAKGGLPTMHKGREDFRDGKHVAGEGDGQSDDIPAMLADGEFVFPADVVSALGNGSTKAGTDKLYEMMHSIRDRARSKGRKDLPPPALKSPLDYLKKR